MLYQLGYTILLIQYSGLAEYSEQNKAKQHQYSSLVLNLIPIKSGLRGLADLILCLGSEFYRQL